MILVLLDKVSMMMILRFISDHIIEDIDDLQDDGEDNGEFDIISNRHQYLQYIPQYNRI